MELTIRPIAYHRGDFATKFGIPRQSGLACGIRSRVVFEPEYRDANALRGLEGYSHIWLIWGFSEFVREGWSPMVKPPRLGGNARMGVFATRSPNRPNPLGLSCVELVCMEKMQGSGTVLHIAGSDLMDGTPIYDIKPYIPFTDSRPGALGGFADERFDYALEVDFPEEWLAMIPPEKRAGLIQALSQDPRPGYRSGGEAVYGFEFAGYDVRFYVKGGVLTVCEIVML